MAVNMQSDATFHIITKNACHRLSHTDILAWYMQQVMDPVKP